MSLLKFIMNLINEKHVKPISLIQYFNIEQINHIIKLIIEFNYLEFMNLLNNNEILIKNCYITIFYYGKKYVDKVILPELMTNIKDSIKPKHKKLIVKFAPDVYVKSEWYSSGTSFGIYAINTDVPEVLNLINEMIKNKTAFVIEEENNKDDLKHNIIVYNQYKNWDGGKIFFNGLKYWLKHSVLKDT